MFLRLRRLVPTLLALGCCGTLGLSAPRAQAATLTVTTLTDSTTVDGCAANDCTLREAITDANADATTTDDIVFAPGLAGGTLTLTQALPDLSTSLNISNPAAQNINLARSTATGTPNFNVLVVYSTGEDDNSSTAPTGSTVALQGLTLTGGVPAGSPGIYRGTSGGGLYVENSTVTLTNCTLSGNTSVQYGGGLFNNGGAVTFTNSTVAGNAAAYYGGGLISFEGALTLTNSTVSGNTLSGGGGAGVELEYSTATFTNSTIANNSVPNTANYSGGLRSNSSIATVTNCTITGNTGRSGIVADSSSGSVTLSNCIVAGNSTSDLSIGGATNTFASSGYNLVGTGDTTAVAAFNQTGDQTGVTPAQLNLGTLANNGGPTQTIALQAGSIAIDAGNTALTNDQRGVKRLVGSADDVGAYEFNGTQSFVVTTLADEDDGTSDPTIGTGTGTSLREAINAANFDPSTTDTITFAPGLAGGTITLNSVLPDLSTSLNISNPVTTAAQTITLARNTATGTPNFGILAVYSAGEDGDSSTAPTGSTIALQGLTLTGGVSAGNPGAYRSFSGGGLYVENSTVALANCTLSGNTGSSYGGGLLNYGGAVTLTNCTIAGNTANSFGGGLISIAGALTLTNSTVSGNTLSGIGGCGVEIEYGTATLTNSTIANNTVPGTASYIYSLRSLSSTTTVANCTITGNTGQGGILADAGTGSVTLSNCIVAGNATSDLSTNGSANTFASSGSNLVGTGDTAAVAAFNQTGDQTGVTVAQLKLGELQNNGGPTETIALLPGSIAVNAGNPNSAGLPATDQRGPGFARVIDSRVDVGAFEAQFVAVHGKVYNAIARAGLSGITVTAVPTTIIFTAPGAKSPRGIAVGKVVTPGTTALTDAQGNYTLYLDSGTYDLSAGDTGSATSRFAPTFSNPVSIPSMGTGTTSYDFRSIGIGGRVISPTNVGVQGITLTLTPEGGTTLPTVLSDAQGFFSFDGLAAGNYTLAPSGGSSLVFAPTSRNLTLADAPLFTSFTATARNQVVGKVYNAVARAGLGGITIRATRSGSNAIIGQALTDEGGNYTLTITPGTYTLTATRVGDTTLRFTALFPNPVTTKAETTVCEFRATGIGGRVISPFNKGVSGVTINAYTGTSNKVFRSAVSDSTGFFSLDALPAGSYTVVPASPNTYTYTPTSRVIQVQDQPVFTSFKAAVKQGSAPRTLEGARSPLTLSSASANVAADTLTLKFTGALDAATVADLSHYSVQVDGVTVEVEGAQLSQGGDTLVLTLPEGTLDHGSQVLIGWAGLLDAQGLPLEGTIRVTAS